jgi:uncharacterized iron-regulated protein
MNFKKIVSLFTGFIALNTIAQIDAQLVKIYDTKSKKEVTLDSIVKRIANYDVVFLGEEHNDSVAHLIEFQLLKMMHQTYPNTSLSMEMFDRDVQLVMNEYLNDIIKEKHFTKDARVWSNYKDYRPLVEYSKTNRIDIVCANSPTRYTNLVGRKGQGALNSLDKKTKQYFAPIPYDTASGAYYNKLANLFGHPSHNVKDTSTKKAMAMPKMNAFNIILAQSLWDATMAYSIANYFQSNKTKKVLQINGRFHSDEHFAIVTQLNRYNKKLKSLVISVSPSDDFDAPIWTDHQHLGDYIILTNPSIKRTF